MEKTSISGLDFDITRIALGTWAIGGWMWGGSDEPESIATIRKALDIGINIIDTAPVYGFGHSESIVGKALKGYADRDKLAIATKAGLEWDEKGRIRRNSSKERIMKEIDDSLRRLQTEYIDIYQVHWPDTSVAFEETAETLLKLKDQGKIRLIGVSNYSPEQMEEFKKAAPLNTNQPPYNLFEREAGESILPYMKKNNIACLAYGALCRGLLSGRMSKDRAFVGDDLRKTDPKFKEPAFSQYLNTVDKLKLFAKEKYSREVIHLAIRWILDRGCETALWGARKPEQFDAVEGVEGWVLNADDMRAIDGILHENLNREFDPGFMAPPKNK